MVNCIPHDYLGIGVYTVPEAARLSGVSQARVHSWLRGYSRAHGDRSIPKVGGQWPSMDGKHVLGFLDLMEVRFIKHFLDGGVKWKTIRIAAQKAREQLHHDHPFATRFISDRLSIFEETLEETGDRRLRDLVDNQFAMFQILEPLLIEGIEFDNHGTAKLWRPSKDQQDVVLDPNRSFGHPIIDSAGVPTAALFDAFSAERDIDRVAAWYEIDRDFVQQAIDFETKWAA